MSRRVVCWVACHLLTCWFLLKLFLRPWKWRRYVPPKLRLQLNRLHVVISQKTIVSILCLWIPPLTFWILDLVFLKLGTYIMAHLNCLFHETLPPVVSVWLSLLSLKAKGSVHYIPPFSARQRLGKPVPAAMNTRYNKRIVGHVILYAAVSYQRKVFVSPYRY
jgi:hypothetical protein